MRAPIALLVPLSLLASAAPASAQDAASLDVEVLKGTFEAHQHDETPEAGTVDDRTLTKGTLELHRVGPGRWRGTATATLEVKLRMIAQGVVTNVGGQDTETGTVELVLDASPPGGYHLMWSMNTITGRTTVDIPTSNIHQSKATQVAYAGTGGFESHGVLPAGGGDVIGESEHPDPAHYRLVKWHLKVDELRAVPRVAAIERGQKAHLDGSASTGHITSYEWKLESEGKGAPDASGFPNGECPPMPMKKLEGETVDATLLCTMKVTLTVYDGPRASAPATVEATVRPRAWRTKVDSKPPLPIYALPAEALFREHLALGKEMCAIGHGTTSVQDTIHRDAQGWNGSAYLLDTIQDANSPFDGWTWVRDDRLRFVRQILLNPELDPKSGTTKKNNDDHHGADFARLRRCVLQHETRHFEREEAYIEAHDPAPIVERTFGPQAEAVDGLAGAAASGPYLAMAPSDFYESDVHDDLENGECKDPGTITVRLNGAPRDKDGKLTVVWVEDSLGPYFKLGD
jgi:hypothetical protein